MKKKLLLNPFFIVIYLILMSFSDPYSIKRISNSEYKYEFYVTSKTITPKENKIYYWFKGGAIHNAQGGIVGNLLNDEFLKTYHNNQIAEYGFFKDGLKIGTWKSWYPNGSLESIQNWSKGLRTGKYLKYDVNGKLEETGHYRKDKKQGYWYNFIKKDTIKFNDDIPIIKKIKLSKSEKLLLKSKKIKEEAIKKTTIQNEENKEKNLIKSQQIILEKEKAKIKFQKKETKEASNLIEKTTLANKKAEKIKRRKTKQELQIKSQDSTKKENFFKRLFGNILKKKTYKKND
ncbi:toxin-antitoxin system YwqK family antitoxin [Flavobacterium polysaccharolyticum]|uniref:MORN repeat variant n=1 Tax=Flavobacterium polysaccharolyticum TaxID=3133148 RepID=A0ABU9NTL5_9FLAO